MIKKRYLMILSIAIVSVLLGGILYNNLALAGKPEPQPRIHKDAVEITVLDWASRYFNDREWGVRVQEDHYEWYPLQKMLFIFDPESELSNVTDLWISIIGTTATSPDFILNITLNGLEVWLGDVHFASDLLGLATIHIENPDINQGVNVIQMNVDDLVLMVHRVTVFIEYEYQA